MSILIVGSDRNPEVARVGEELTARGAVWALLDTRAFPEKGVLSFGEGGVEFRRRALPAPGAVYLRGLACHPLMPGFEEELRKRPRGWVAQCEEKRALLEAVLLDFERNGARLINSLEANAQHGQKPYQLELLRDAGVPVPRWIATNDPKAVRAFVRDIGRVVYKPIGGGASVRLIEKSDLSRERLAALRYAPVLFQEYAEGVAVRAYVVGRRVVASAEIHSTEVDYRRKEDRVEATRLTPDERRAAAGAARACGMAFTGVDLIRGVGRFVVLECNPSPMFAVFERKTGRDVAGPFAELLMRLGLRRDRNATRGDFMMQ